FVQIAISLAPLDLLHLARVSKELRQICLARQSRHMWIAAMRNVPGLPACPACFISEPRYTALVYDRFCLACGIGRAGGVEYGIAMRFCGACHKTKSVLVLYSLCQFTNICAALSRVRSLCHPPTAFCRAYTTSEYLCSNRSSLKNSGKGEYYEPEFKAIVKQYLDIQHKPTELEEFVSGRREYATAMMQASHAFYSWLHDENLCCSHAALPQNCHFYSIVQNLKDLGYTTADFPETDQWLNVLDQPRKLTPRIWENIKPKLIAQIEEEKTNRLCIEFEKNVAARCKEIHKYYLEYLDKTMAAEEQKTMPNLATFSLLPSVKALTTRNDALVPLTTEDFETIVPAMLTEAQMHKIRVQKDLLEMLYRDMLRNGQTSNVGAIGNIFCGPCDPVMTHACALFSCHDYCLNTPLPYFDILNHFRTAHPTVVWDMTNWAPGTQQIRGWRWDPAWIGAAEGITQLVSSALRVLGLRLDASSTDLDELVRARRLWCSCGYPLFPLTAESTWFSLVSSLPTVAGSTPIIVAAGFIFDDHATHGQSSCTCLKLLPYGQTFNTISSTSFDEKSVTTIQKFLDTRIKCPSCAICRKFMPRGRYGADVLPRDAVAIAHHMRTKYA
ncbi:hypothetical protein BKA93DRAFT_739890, partial [Sparassis latifolia]